MIAASLILGAAGLLVFAPEGRETVSYVIGGALSIFAAGAAGFKRVWGKTPITSVGADQSQEQLGAFIEGESNPEETSLLKKGIFVGKNDPT